MTNVRAMVFLVVFTVSSGHVGAESETEHKLQAVLDQFIADNPAIPGVVVTFDSDQLDLHWSGAAGIANLEPRKAIAPDQPLRLASITKTYVAAAVLRLMEQGKINLDDSLSRYLPASQLEVLKQGKYDPEAITIRHLLTHTSGLFDYAMSDAFFGAVTADPTHKWTRNEQLQLAMDHGAPYGAPGEVFHYSDTGYILLGEIIERRSGLGLAPALRALLKFDSAGLKSTWLETLEPAPDAVPPMIHQYWGEADTTGWDASFDLFGGGGLVANMPDLARFFKALFEDGVYDEQQTLATMLTSVIPQHGGPAYQSSANGTSQYCLGVIAYSYNDYTIFGHGGFWGIQGGYLPGLKLAFGMAVNQQESQEQRRDLMAVLLDLVLNR